MQICLSNCETAAEEIVQVWTFFSAISLSLLTSCLVHCLSIPLATTTTTALPVLLNIPPLYIKYIWVKGELANYHHRVIYWLCILQRGITLLKKWISDLNQRVVCVYGFVTFLKYLKWLDLKLSCLVLQLDKIRFNFIVTTHGTRTKLSQSITISALNNIISYKLPKYVFTMDRLDIKISTTVQWRWYRIKKIKLQWDQKWKI